MERKIRTSITFDPDILERIETVKGRLNRSAWVNMELDKVLIIEEQKLELS